MGTVTINQIKQRAKDIVQDTDDVRWADPEVVRWVNDGLTYAVKKRVSLYTLRATVALDANTPRNQIAAAGAFAVVDVPYTVDASNIPQRTVRQATQDTISAVDPAWLVSSGDVVRHWIPGPEPKVFFVYPAVPKTVGLVRRVEVVYAANPPQLSATTDVIPIDDVYAYALVNYVLFRFYSKDAENAANAQLAQTYLTIFNTYLGA